MKVKKYIDKVSEPEKCSYVLVNPSSSSAPRIHVHPELGFYRKDDMSKVSMSTVDGRVLFHVRCVGRPDTTVTFINEDGVEMTANGKTTENYYIIEVDSVDGIKPRYRYVVIEDMDIIIGPDKTNIGFMYGRADTYQSALRIMSGVLWDHEEFFE